MGKDNKDNKELFRYSVNTGEAGGVVYAKNFAAAENMLREKYQGELAIIGLAAWPWKDDLYFDSRYGYIIECYGS